MKDFLRQNGILLLVIAFLLSVLIGVLSFVMGGKADPLSNLVNTVTAPVRSGIAAAADWVEAGPGGRAGGGGPPGRGGQPGE